MIKLPKAKNDVTSLNVSGFRVSGIQFHLLLFLTNEKLLLLDMLYYCVYCLLLLDYLPRICQDKIKLLKNASKKLSLIYKYFKNSI